VILLPSTVVDPKRLPLLSVAAQSSDLPLLHVARQISHVLALILPPCIEIPPRHHYSSIRARHRVDQTRLKAFTALSTEDET
jgi:hypothetical protein